MKALIQGGLLLTLGWLGHHADAQETQWQASSLRHANPIVAANRGTAPVGLGQPVRLDGGSGIAPVSLRRVVRGQAPIEISVQPPLKLEKDGKDDKPSVLVQKDGGFKPPTPAAIIPGPVLDSIGCGDDVGICGPRWGGAGVFGDLGCCPDRGRCWMTGEYLLWWQRSQAVPPLVTSSPAGTPQNQIGVLGAPATTILYDQTPNRTRGGGRFAFGRWLPHFGDNVGLETNFFFLGRQDATATFGAGGAFLARPFFSQQLGQNNSEIVIDNNGTGSVWINNYSQLWGIEANLRHKWRCGPGWWVDALCGYRHLNLSEGIDIREDQLITRNIAGIDAGTRFSESESFHTRTQFNGGQFGLDGECRVWNRWFLGVTAKVAFGNAHQIVTIDGSTTRTLPNGVVATEQGALLATQTNIGKFTQNRFAVLPEVAVKFGYDITDNLRVFVGYDFIYLSSVVRPGEQIDLNVNSNFRPSFFTGGAAPTGPRVPAVLFRTNDYWAQGMTFGMQYRW